MLCNCYISLFLPRTTLPNSPSCSLLSCSTLTIWSPNFSISPYFSIIFFSKYLICTIYCNYFILFSCIFFNSLSFYFLILFNYYIIFSFSYSIFISNSLITLFMFCFDGFFKILVDKASMRLEMVKEEDRNVELGSCSSGVFNMLEEADMFYLFYSN